MDTGKFDNFTKTLSEGSTRRGALKGILGGGAAALFVAIGLRGTEAQEVTAERRRRRRRRRVTSGTPQTCVTQTGVALNPTGQANGTACTGGSAAACLSGFCTATICQPCPVTCNLLSGTAVCCPNGSECLSGACKRCVAGTPAPTPRRRRRDRRNKR